MSTLPDLDLLGELAALRQDMGALELRNSELKDVALALRVGEGARVKRQLACRRTLR